MSALKACPACGNQYPTMESEYLSVDYDLEYKHYFVSCGDKNCGFRTESFVGEVDSDEASAKRRATRTWNRRKGGKHDQRRSSPARD